MIIFTPIDNIKELMYAYRSDAYSYNFYEYSLSSITARAYPIMELLPNPELMSIPYEGVITAFEDPEFDAAYATYVLQNRDQFLTLMRLVLPLYDDPNACVIVYIADSPVRNVISESLIKLIEQRYGYATYIIYEPHDLECLKDDMSFSPRGILNIQEDAHKATLEGYYGPIVIPGE